MLILSKPGSLQAQPGFYQSQDGDTAMTKIHIEPYWSEVKPSENYVYLHIRISDGLVFHVGKGTKERGWDAWSRSNWWKWVARKHGCRVEIYRDGMHELCALSLEKILIAKYRSLGHPITNMTDGGEGVVGLEMPFRKPVCNSRGEISIRNGCGESL